MNKNRFEVIHILNEGRAILDNETALIYRCSDINVINKLQQENENLRATIKNDDIAVNRLCEENKQLKEKIDKIKKYIKYDTQGGMWHIRGSEDAVKDVVENDILEIIEDDK